MIDIVVKAKDETKAGFGAADKGASSFGDKVGKAGKVAAAGLAVLAGAAVGATLKAEEVASANARVSNVLDSMGYGEATDRVLAHAEALEMQLGVDEKVIKETQAKLATFGELTKSVDEAGGAFDRATAASIDMAAAGFGTAEGNAVQLGKALNDPIKGLSALAKSGVTFTETEQKKIKTLVESNKMGKAQEMVLAAIEKQVGGTAEATGDSSEKMKLAFGNVVETIGAALLPHMDKLAEIVQKVAGVMEENSSVILIAGGVLAGLAVGVLAVNAAMKVYRAGVIVATAVQWALNAAMLANPIGLVVLAIAGLVAAFVILWKKSAAFRNFWKAMWAGVKAVAVAAKDQIVKAWNAAMGFFRGVPGKIKGAFSGIAAIMKAPFVDAWDRAKGIWQGAMDFFRGIPGKVKGAFGGLATALKTPFTSAFSAIKSLWNSTAGGFGFSIPDWVPKIGGNSFTIPSMAHGGIGGGLTMVGERGRELVRLPHGSTVIPNGTTENMMGGGGGRTVIELRSSGSRTDDLLLELLRNAIRVRGGNVQLVLGRA